MEIKLVNLSQNTELVLSHDAFDYVLETVDWGKVKSTTNTVQYVNLLGAAIQSTSLQPREIEIIVWLVSHSKQEMTDKKAFMNKFINPLQDIECVYGDYSLIMRPVASIQYNNKEIRYNNQILCRCLIQATAPMPLWGLYKNKTITSKSTRETPFWPLIIPAGVGKTFGIIPADAAYSIENTGDVAVGLIALLQASGDVVKPKLLDKNTGKYFEFNVTLHDGDTLEVSTVTGNKYARLTSNDITTDILRDLTQGSSMSVTLSTGVNNFALRAENGASNVTLSISYSPLWLEVQEAEEY